MTHKTSDSLNVLPKEKILRKTTTLELIERPIIKRVDRRGGLTKLKDIVFFLRDHGYRDDEKFPYDDVEYAIIEVTQGLDKRTIRKYHDQLLRFHYLKPAGHPLSKVATVTVRKGEEVTQKQYSSRKGYSHYVFGSFAPKHLQETVLHAHENEVTSKICVCDSREVILQGKECEKTVLEVVSPIEIDREERRNTDTHTYRSSESNLRPEERRILKAAEDKGGG